MGVKRSATEPQQGTHHERCLASGRNAFFGSSICGAALSSAALLPLLPTTPLGLLPSKPSTSRSACRSASAIWAQSAAETFPCTAITQLGVVLLASVVVVVVVVVLVIVEVKCGTPKPYARSSGHTTESFPPAAAAASTSRPCWSTSERQSTRAPTAPRGLPRLAPPLAVLPVGGDGGR